MNEKLIERIKENRDMRERVRRREKDAQERESTIRDALPEVKADFWCDGCKKDFTSTGRKVASYVTGVPVAWYTARCKCGRKAIRRITDKSRDPYYKKSFLIRFQRVRNYNDMLSPADDLFKIIYPKEYARLNGRDEPRG